MSGIRRPGARTRIILAFAIMVGVLSVSLTVRASEHHTATRTDVSFSYIEAEEVDPGESWVDDAGVLHIRDLVEVGEMSGDIEGSVTVTSNVDVEDVSAIFCEAGSPADCQVIFNFSWGTVEIVSDNGRWLGRYQFNDVIAEGVDEADLPVFPFTSLFLRGEGEYAHQSISAQIASANEELSEITFAGVRSTLATPIDGLNISVQFCAGFDGSVSGGFQATGLVESSGSVVSDQPVATGGRWTHEHYGVWGRTVLQDDNGSITLDYLINVQDYSIPIGSVGWGQFIIADGSGEYAELYGQGRFVGSVSERPGCGDGINVHFYFIGEAHLNAAPPPPPPSVEEMAEQRWAELQAANYQENWMSWKGDLYRGQGPHGMLLTTYLNPSAEEASASQPGVMPDDAVIVKENYTAEGEFDSVTAMFKQPGYDSEHGDWFFAKYFPDGAIDVAGSPDGCVACHGAARSNDYVYSFPVAPIEAEMIEPTEDDLAMANAQWEMLQSADYQDSWATVPGKGELYLGQVPHGALLSTYLNAEAEAGASSPDAMPADAIIVKENYTEDAELAALTVMQKIPDYDPEHGDWFWTRFDPSGEILAAGQAAGCVACHGAVETNDFVFTFPVVPLDLSSSEPAAAVEETNQVVRQVAIFSVPVLALVMILGLRRLERRQIPGQRR